MKANYKVFNKPDSHMCDARDFINSLDKDDLISVNTSIRYNSFLSSSETSKTIVWYWGK